MNSTNQSKPRLHQYRLASDQKMLKPILSLVGSILLFGCATPTLTIQDPTPKDIVRFDADSVEVVLSAAIEPRRADPWSSRPVPLYEEIQTQLHEAIMRNAASHIVAAEIGTEKKVIVQISRAVITDTVQAIKNVPFVGILALGMKEEYSVIIEGYVEIEDDQGRVISRAPIRANAKELAVNGADILNKVIEDALILLHDEIIRNSRRYLHAYLL
jgi:hypothetical protein